MCIRRALESQAFAVEEKHALYTAELASVHIFHAWADFLLISIACDNILALGLGVEGFVGGAVETHWRQTAICSGFGELCGKLQNY